MNAQELRELREAAGLSRQALADKLPWLKFRTLEGYEQERRKIPVLAQRALQTYFNRHSHS